MNIFDKQAHLFDKQGNFYNGVAYMPDTDTERYHPYFLDPGCTTGFEFIESENYIRGFLTRLNVRTLCWAIDNLPNILLVKKVHKVFDTIVDAYDQKKLFFKYNEDLYTNFLPGITVEDYKTEASILSDNLSEVATELNTILTELQEYLDSNFLKSRVGEFMNRGNSIYFRLCSTDYDWTDLIWELVNEYKSNLTYVTVNNEADLELEPICYIDDQPIADMLVNNFLAAEGKVEQR